MKIGETIKKLRKEKDVTQEKLADYLGISYQAVSKWENGTALPDITLVVPLANFFEVSADYLFTLNQETNDEKVNEYKQKCLAFFNAGKMQSCINLMREALTEYPRNFWFMLHLARAIQWYHYDGTPTFKENRDTDIAEIIQLCERILEDCTDSTIRQETLQVLCVAYQNSGQKEKAIKIAKETAYFSASQDWLLSMIYDGDDLIYHQQKNILTYSSFTAHELLNLSHNMENNKQAKHLKAALNIYETIFYDGNALHYHSHMTEICFRLAKCFILSDIEKAMEYLLLTEKHANGADTMPNENTYYTSMFVDRHFHSSKNTMKSYTETKCEGFLKELDSNTFAPLYDNPAFDELKKRLRKTVDIK
jgi:transcriptional regulator with XRE-family HTH domain